MYGFFDCLKDDPDYLIEILMGYMLHFVHLDKLAEGLRSLREDIVSLKQSILEEKLKLELEIILKRLDETEKEKDEREKEEEEFINLMQKKIDDFQKSKGVKRAQILEEIYIFLQSDNTTEILHALCALGKLQLSETTERILPLLEHWDRYIQRETIESLAKIGSANAREPLNNLLEKETNSLTRGRILEARGRIWEALYRPKD